jgi:excisionase family DNA binding protein
MPNEAGKSKTMTVKQAAEYIGAHPETIRRLLRENKIKGERTLTHFWRVDRESVEAYAREYKVEG